MAVKSKIYKLNAAQVLTSWDDVLIAQSRLSSISRSLERKAGVFQYGDFPVVAENLAEGFFADYDEDVLYFIEVQDGPDAWDGTNTVIFYGIIDPDSIEFDKPSLTTKLSCYTFDKLLERSPDIEPRGVAKTGLLHRFHFDIVEDTLIAPGHPKGMYSGLSGVWIFPTPSDNNDLKGTRIDLYWSDELQAAGYGTEGVTFVMNQSYSDASGQDLIPSTFEGGAEYRFISRQAAVNLPDPDGSYWIKFNDTDILQRILLEYNIFQHEYELVDAANRWVRLHDFRLQYKPDIFRYGRFCVWIYDGAGAYELHAFGINDVRLFEDSGIDIQLDDESENYPTRFEPVDLWDGSNGFKLNWGLLPYTQIDDSDITIFGPELYGTTTAGTTDDFELVESVEALLAIVPVLKDFSPLVELSGDTNTISRLFNFSRRPDEALNEMCNVCNVFAAIESGDRDPGTGLRPPVFHLYQRDWIQSQVAEEISIPITWSEKITGKRPVMLVKGHAPINRITDDVSESLGWYYEDENGVDQTTEYISHPPQGSWIIEVDIKLALPSGPAYFDDAIKEGWYYNDPAIKAFAEAYYRFYAKYFRKATLLVNDILSGKVAKIITEPYQEKSAMVISEEIDYVSRDTLLTVLLSSDLGGETPEEEIPSAPTLNSATVKTEAVALAWSAPATGPVTSYKVYWGTATGVYTNSVSVGLTSSYQVNGLVNGTLYFFVVAAVNSTGEGPKSNELSQTPADITLPAKPVLVSAIQDGDDEVDLVWDAVTDLDLAGYIVVWSLDPDFDPLDPGSSANTWTLDVGNVVVYTLTGLDEGETYYFAVQSYDTAVPANISRTSNRLSVVMGTIAPAAPVLDTATPGDANVFLEWTAPADLDIAGYKIFWGTTTGLYSNSLDVGLQVPTDFTINGLNNGTEYFFVVKAYDTGGLESPVSNQLSAEPVAVVVPDVPDAERVSVLPDDPDDGVLAQLEGVGLLTFDPVVGWRKTSDDSGFPVLLHQLKAFWPLDEVSGTRADAHGANDLTDNNTVTQGAGPGNAAKFTAADTDYLSVNTLNVGSNEVFWFSFWYRKTATPGSTFTLLDNAQVQLQQRNDGKLRLVVGSGAVIHATNLSNNWHRVDIFYDGATAYLRVDDSVEASIAATHTGFTGIDFGCKTGGLNWYCQHFSFHTRIPLSDELTWIYNAGAGRRFNEYGQVGDDGSNLLANLVSYWVLGEISGVRPDAYGVNDLTDNNTVGAIQGRVEVGKAGDFVGANSEYLSAADADDLELDNDWSFGIWFYPVSGSGNQSIFRKGEYMFQAGSNSALFYWKTSSPSQVESFSNSLKPTADAWDLIIFTYDSSESLLTAHLVGQNVSGTVVAVTPLSSNASDLLIGLTQGRVMNGRAALALKTNRVLTASERTWLWNHGQGRTFAEMGDYFGV